MRTLATTWGAGGGCVREHPQLQALLEEKKEKKKKDKLGGGSKGNVVAEGLRESSESTLVRYCVCVASKHCGVLL